MNYRKLVLDRLLDKYEKSRSFTDESSKRRILLKMGSRDFPEYDIEQPLVRETFNSAVLELAARELVCFEWLKHEQGNIIDKVWLNVPNVEKAYLEISRKPKRSVLDNILKRAAELAEIIDAREEGAAAGAGRASTGIEAAPNSSMKMSRVEASENTRVKWEKRFLDDVIASIKDRVSTAGLLPEDEEQSLAILKAIDEINRLRGKECLERVFSLRCYGNSKYFEKKVRGRMVGILRRYCIGTEESEEMTEDDILMQAGILQSPEYVEFQGCITGRLAGKTIDFSSFLYGASINADTVRGLEIEDMGPVKKVLFIENKANYVDFTAGNRDAGMMTVYLGGFYSPLKGIFIKKLYEKASVQGVEFYHWSDIDLGGFLIFNRLKTNIITELKPYLMDRTALSGMLKHAVPFDGRYAARLEKLLEEDQFNVFRDVIRFMLENRVRLEQEAFLLTGHMKDGVEHELG